MPHDSARPPRGRGLKGLGDSAEIDHRDGYVADDPAIVAGRDGRDVAFLQVELATIRHHYVQLPSGEVDEVRRVAKLSAADDRLLVVRPFPARLEGGAPNAGAGDVNDVDPAMLH